jgi:hypothetical protein
MRFIDDQLGTLFARRWSFEGAEYTEHFLVNYRPILVGWCWVDLRLAPCRAEVRRWRDGP